LAAAYERYLLNPLAKLATSELADKRRTVTLFASFKSAENLRILLSYVLTPKMMERSIRLGWSKVVGSGSNLVTTDHLVTFPEKATRQLY
jgi:hypothetical protein